MIGIFLISFAVLLSAVSSTNIGVLSGVGACFLLGYLSGFLPKLKECTIAKLMKTTPLLAPAADLGEYTASILITALLSIASIALGAIIFNKKQL